MPANWASWSLRYLGTAGAAPTPANQDAVARHKLIALYGWLGSWGSVAHWWLTGDGDTDPAHWSAFSRSYVDEHPVADGCARAPRRPGAGAGAPARGAAKPAHPQQHPRRSPSSTSRTTRFTTRAAGVRPSTPATAAARSATRSKRRRRSRSASTGHRSPGSARRAQPGDRPASTSKTSSSGRSTSTPATSSREPTLFSMTFDRMGDYTIRIEVVGTPGRQTIALDEFDVGG